MDTSGPGTAHTIDEGTVELPAYGPIEASLGYLLFYVLVDRVTPAIVTVFSETVLDLSPSFVRFALAVALWFVLAVSVIDQLQRQLAALGVGTYDQAQLRLWSRVTPSSLRTAGYVLVFLAGSIVAAMTFESAVETLSALIPAIATAEVSTTDPIGVFAMVVFFLAYGTAARSLDRLVIGGIRALVSDRDD
ncbi:hypothetical protein [Halapricum hydrolyticum]|uniref:Uncharacterized protein n=1 Tax=Halapricum hydrolyticum TaxID=2979991 RepID=A0AAE3IG46_9EURY|nr:hypothetical protein [Halapricum hydrolyticum]MCU4718728.1 hypothetical protein [Halapricum hydrolyticum]MCU4727715.1 hypothetical protein [Halapricum hydrolyticum]